MRALLAGIATCTIDQANGIRNKAAEAILQIFDPDFVHQWDGSRPDWRAPLDDGSSVDSSQILRRFWRVSSQILLSLGKLVLDIKGEIDKTNLPVELVGAGASGGATASLASIRYLLQLIRELLRRRNEHLRRYSPDVLAIATSVQDRLAASVALEVALLVFVCCSEPSVAICAIQCLGYMLEEAEITGEAPTGRANWSVADFSELQLGQPAEDDASIHTSRLTAGAANSTSTGSLLTVVENISMFEEYNTQSRFSPDPPQSPS